MHKCRTQRPGWLEYREQRKDVWGEIREGQMRQSVMGHIKEFGLILRAVGSH